MFMVISKDKIVSYLISLGTVMGLFVFSFFISEQNDRILKSSANIMENNNYVVINEENTLKDVEKDGNITKMLQK